METRLLGDNLEKSYAEMQNTQAQTKKCSHEETIRQLKASRGELFCEIEKTMSCEKILWEIEEICFFADTKITDKILEKVYRAFKILRGC